MIHGRSNLRGSICLCGYAQLTSLIRQYRHYYAYVNEERSHFPPRGYILAPKQSISPPPQYLFVGRHSNLSKCMTTIRNLLMHFGGLCN